MAIFHCYVSSPEGILSGGFGAINVTNANPTPASRAGHWIDIHQRHLDGTRTLGVVPCELANEASKWKKQLGKPGVFA